MEKSQAWKKGAVQRQTWGEPTATSRQVFPSKQPVCVNTHLFPVTLPSTYHSPHTSHTICTTNTHIIYHTVYHKIYPTLHHPTLLTNHTPHCTPHIPPPHTHIYTTNTHYVLQPHHIHITHHIPYMLTYTHTIYYTDHTYYIPHTFLHMSHTHSPHMLTHIPHELLYSDPGLEMRLRDTYGMMVT